MILSVIRVFDIVSKLAIGAVRVTSHALQLFSPILAAASQHTIGGVLTVDRMLLLVALGSPSEQGSRLGPDHCSIKIRVVDLVAAGTAEKFGPVYVHSKVMARCGLRMETSMGSFRRGPTAYGCTQETCIQAAMSTTTGSTAGYLFLLPLDASTAGCTSRSQALLQHAKTFGAMLQSVLQQVLAGFVSLRGPPKLMFGPHRGTVTDIPTSQQPTPLPSSS